jgi:HNH endonuclease
VVNVAEHQIETLASLCLPRSSAVDWDPTSAKVALQQVRRLRGELAAFEAVLVGVMKTETGRDTRTTLARGFGMSGAEASKTEDVADIVGRVSGAHNALASGAVTGEHLRHLKAIVDNDEAAELLALAPSQSPDKFRRTVQEYLIDRDAEGVKERQRKARSLQFFKTKDGCVGMRVILPTLEGEQLKAAINTECDAAWRAAHPERAETLGGHHDEPREQRLADALVALLNGTALGGQARTALIITMQAETLRCDIAGAGPIPTQDALKLVDDPRTDIYAAIQEADGAIMKFGRSKRFATPMQKLALALRDGGFCTKPGCEQPWYRCDADHVKEWDAGGLTDIEELRLLCRCSCHKQRHETGQDHTRQRDGTWTVDDETLPAFSPIDLAA